MKRTPVSSSNLESVGYDESTKTLEIAFLNGTIYRYLGVPPSIYRGLMSASSHGSYLDQFIKKAGYSYFQIQ